MQNRIPQTLLSIQVLIVAIWPVCATFLRITAPYLIKDKVDYLAIASAIGFSTNLALAAVLSNNYKNIVVWKFVVLLLLAFAVIQSGGFILKAVQERPEGTFAILMLAAITTGLLSAGAILLASRFLLQFRNLPVA